MNQVERATELLEIAEQQTGLMSLDDFLSMSDQYPRSEYVRHPGFAELYIRKHKRPMLFGNEFVITIARVEAVVKGKKTFTKLVYDLKEFLREKQASAIKCTKRLDVALIVECVYNERLIRWLEYNGFVNDNPGGLGAPSFRWALKGGR